MRTRINILNSTRTKRGAPLKGARLRQRYNVTMDPDLVDAGKKLALSSDKSFSELLEDGLKFQLAQMKATFKE